MPSIGAGVPSHSLWPFKSLAWPLLDLLFSSCGCMCASWAMHKVYFGFLGGCRACTSFQRILQPRLSLGPIRALLGPHEQQCNVGLEHGARTRQRANMRNAQRARSTSSARAANFIQVLMAFGCTSPFGSTQVVSNLHFHDDECCYCSTWFSLRGPLVLRNVDEQPRSPV